MKKDGRADIRINKVIKEGLALIGMTPQKIVDNWVKRNLKKITKALGEKDENDNSK